MDELGEWKIYNVSFLVVASVTCLNCFVAAIFTGINLKAHYFSNYNLSIKSWIIVCFIIEFMAILLLLLALFFFAFAQAFFISIGILTSFFVIFFFAYIQENMTFFLWKFCQSNPKLKHRIVMERINRSKMFKYDYPMDEYSLLKQIDVKGLYTKYCYLLEGRGRVYYFFHKSIYNFAEAHSFHRENNLIIWGYMLTVPIVTICEYILQVTGTITIQDFNLKSVFRVYILAMSFWASVTIQSFSRSFYKIMPFSHFEAQLTTMVSIKTGFDITSSVLRLQSFTIGPYGEFETFQLVFVAAFSLEFMILCIMQYWFMSPEKISIHSEKSLVINFSEFDAEHQLNSQAGLSSIRESNSENNESIIDFKNKGDFINDDQKDNNDIEINKEENKPKYNTFEPEEKKNDL